MAGRLATKGKLSLVIVILASQCLFVCRHLLRRHQHSLFPPSDIRQGTFHSEDVTRVQGFSWDDVDLKAGPDGCGGFKCFFRSSSNSSLGYAIGYSYPDDDVDGEAPLMSLFEKLEEAWEVSQKLKRKFPNSVRTGLLQPPEMIPIPSEEILSPLRSSILKAARSQPPIGHFHYLESTSLLKNFSKADNVMMAVQKSERFPSLHLRLTCPLDPITTSRLRWFFNEVGDTESFARRFDEERKVLKEAMKAEPRLWSDFQILLDRHGNFYYIDLDRVVGEIPPLKKLLLAKNTCLDYLTDVKNIITAGGETLPQAGLLNFRSPALTKLLSLVNLWPE